ncbi:MAG: GntR family transcriptional regulator [Bacillus sp. (in: Bacteria)]|nr:GntR family transcriptional regulator [Bacillus sp. (in: firmicutes)]
MLDKNSPLPIYYQLEEEIRRSIQSGEFKPGDLLPSEREYSERYEISRMTVRQAITKLATEGLIVRQKGRGTFIAEKAIEQPLKGITSFTEEILSRNMTPTSSIIHFKEVEVNEPIREKLKLDEGSIVYEIYRVRLADGNPIAVELTYTPKTIVGNLSAEEFNQQSFYDYVEKKLNLKISYGEQEIESVLANEMEIEHLNLEQGNPILLVHRLTMLIDGTPFEYCRTSYRADKYKYRIQLER